MEMNWAAGKDLSCKLKYWNVPRNPVLSKIFQAIWLDKLNEFAKRSALDVSISCWRYFTSLEIFVFQTEWTSRWGALPLPRVEAKLFSRKVQLRIKRYFYSPWCKRAKIFGLNCSWLPYSTYLYLDFHLDDIDILQKKWSKTLIPAWNRSSNILLPPICSCHHLLCSITKYFEEPRILEEKRSLGNKDI